jgi:hypothetical protein
MPLNPANGQFDLVEQFGTADLYGDLLGYFARPANYGGTHVITGQYATDAGGYSNTASGSVSTVGGGYVNTASGVYSTVGGGFKNTAIGQSSIVAGGFSNTASNDYSTVGGGLGNTASGFFSTVAGGNANTASAGSSFAAGVQANADGFGCFAFSNWSGGLNGGCLGTAYVARFTLDHGLSVDYYSRRSDGGGTRYVYFGDLFAGQTIVTWTGAFLSDAGVWVNASSAKTGKTDFADVDPQDVLRKVAQLPITTWRYKEGEGAVRHIGPMAEDFDAAFNVGYGPHTIADLDARGVALAAIQGLNAKLEANIAERDGQIARQEKEIADLRRAVEVLMTRTSAEGKVAQTH